jgi:HD superfamily phosphodiesterase
MKTKVEKYNDVQKQINKHAEKMSEIAKGYVEKKIVYKNGAVIRSLKNEIYKINENSSLDVMCGILWVAFKSKDYTEHITLACVNNEGILTTVAPQSKRKYVTEKQVKRVYENILKFKEKIRLEREKIPAFFVLEEEYK